MSSLASTTRFGRCPCGGGTYEERMIEVPMTVRGEAIVLTDVPQGFCLTCGSRVYKARTLEGVERVMAGRGPSKPRARL